MKQENKTLIVKQSSKNSALALLLAEAAVKHGVEIINSAI